MQIELLPLMKPDHLGNRVFRRDRDQHVDVISHQMAFLDPAFPWRSFSATHANVELPLVAPAELEA
jgi:hypothetical protein